MKNNKQRYNRMFVETPEQEERFSSESEENKVYTNSYIAPEEKEEETEERDGVAVTVPEEPKAPVLKKYRSKTNVNFRLTPDIKRTDNIIGVLKMSEIVSQIDDTFENGFVHVEYERKKGYIQKAYLEEV